MRRKVVSRIERLEERFKPAEDNDGWCIDLSLITEDEEHLLDQAVDVFYSGREPTEAEDQLLKDAAVIVQSVRNQQERRVIT